MSEQQTNAIYSEKLKWILVATGFFTGILGSISLGTGFVLYPGILVLGALAQRRFQIFGRGLSCFGAILLTFWVFDIGFLMLRQGVLSPVLSAALTLVSCVLVTVSDVMLVMEEMKIRHGSD